jgi:hypothetical protein
MPLKTHYKHVFNNITSTCCQYNLCLVDSLFYIVENIRYILSFQNIVVLSLLSLYLEKD